MRTLLAMIGASILAVPLLLAHRCRGATAILPR